MISIIVALIGVWRCWRNRTLQLTAVILMVLPGILLIITDLTAKSCSASCCSPPLSSRSMRPLPSFPSMAGMPAWREAIVATAVLTAVLLPGFLLGYYGKERQTTSRRQKCKRRHGSVSVPDLAPCWLREAGTPAQFRNYENFTYVPIDREPQESWGPSLPIRRGCCQIGWAIPATPTAMY